MPKCKACGKKFHACGSCGIYTNWEYEYCSKACYAPEQVDIERRYLLRIAAVFLGDGVDLQELTFEQMGTVIGALKDFAEEWEE